MMKPVVFRIHCVKDTASILHEIKLIYKVHRSIEFNIFGYMLYMSIFGRTCDYIVKK